MNLTCAQCSIHSVAAQQLDAGERTLYRQALSGRALADCLALQFLTAIVPKLRTLLHITPNNLVDSAVISASALYLCSLMKEQREEVEEWINQLYD